MSRNPPAGGLLVLIDRCTREYLIERLGSLSQEAVARALKRMRRRAVLARAVRTRAAAPSSTTQHRKGHINETVRITPKVPQKNFLAGVSFRLQFKAPQAASEEINFFSQEGLTRGVRKCLMVSSNVKTRQTECRGDAHDDYRSSGRRTRA